MLGVKVWIEKGILYNKAKESTKKISL